MGTPVEIFIHDPELPDHEARIEIAKSICETCPFKTQCLEFGKSSNSVGVWGGEFLDLPEETAENK